MLEKLTSRKFWMSFAALLGSIGTTVAGLASDNETVVIVGVVCAVLSSAIYSLIEGFVDAKAVQAFATEEITVTEETVTTTEEE